jgi:hypothetical protein
MKIAQAVYGPSMRPRFETGDLGGEADLVLAFGAAHLLAERPEFDRLRSRHPQAILVACSSSLSICGTRVLENSLVATAIRFDATRLHIASLDVPRAGLSGAAGQALADALPRRNLSHVLAFGDALSIDAAAFSSAIGAGLPPGVGLGGWLAGSGDSRPGFVCADRPAASGTVVLLGFYGQRLRITSGRCTVDARGAQLAILAASGEEGGTPKGAIEEEAQGARTMLGEHVALAGFPARDELDVRPAAAQRAIHGRLSLTAISEP